MQIETFKIFRDLVETGSFSKAAELNTITQSAVSQQIRALEKRFKTALIRRRKKNFSITPEGNALLQASQEILRTYENLGDRLRELKDHVSGNLVIATVHSIGLHELPRSLRVFRRAYPTVEVTVEYLRSAQVYQSVAAGNSDVGLVAYPARHRGVTVESHWKDKLVLICPQHRDQFPFWRALHFVRVRSTDEESDGPDLPREQRHDSAIDGVRQYRNREESGRDR
jgi:DNA-binding transcriptional LysR family regulator